VAGFSALMGRFPWEKEFILRVKRDPFHRGKAGTVDARDNAVIAGTNMVTGPVTGLP